MEDPQSSKTNGKETIKDAKDSKPVSGEGEEGSGLANISHTNLTKYYKNLLNHSTVPKDIIENATSLMILKRAKPRMQKVILTHCSIRFINFLFVTYMNILSKELPINEEFYRKFTWVRNKDAGSRLKCLKRMENKRDFFVDNLSFTHLILDPIVYLIKHHSSFGNTTANNSDKE